MKKIIKHSKAHFDSDSIDGDDNLRFRFYFRSSMSPLLGFHFRSLYMAGRRKKKSKSSSLVCEDIDRISELPDELLLQILLFLPTKDAVSTSILSKRWEVLWLYLPKLKYVCRYRPLSEIESLSRFLDRNLALHRAPVIESLHLNFNSPARFKPEDIKLWVVLALSHHLLKLNITYRSNPNKPNILPSSLYICKSLVTLKLSGDIRLDVPRMVCLPSLKTLRLRSNRYLDRECLQRLLSVCPVLEDLLVDCDCGEEYDDNMGLITVAVPSLHRLSFYVPSVSYGLLDGLVIDTPSLKYLKIQNKNEGGHPCLIESSMPNLEEAYIDFRYRDYSSLIGGITSVKRLTICLEDVVYKGGFVFNQLEHLKLCVCGCSVNLLLNILVHLLEDSPNLRVLDIFEIDHYDDFLWDDEPSTAPECILSYLQKYLGRPEKRDLEVNIFEEPLLLEDCNNNVV